MCLDTGFWLILTRAGKEDRFYGGIPVSGWLLSSAGSEGGSRLSSRLLIRFLSWISSLRRCLTWDDSSGRGCPFTAETRSIISLDWRRASMRSTMKRADYPGELLNELFQAPRHTRSLTHWLTVESTRLLHESHVWDTHMHVRLRSHRPAIDLYKLGLEKYTSLHIFPPLPLFSIASLYDPFGRKRQGCNQKHRTGNHIIYFTLIYWTTRWRPDIFFKSGVHEITTQTKCKHSIPNLYLCTMCVMAPPGGRLYVMVKWSTSRIPSMQIRCKVKVMNSLHSLDCKHARFYIIGANCSLHHTGPLLIIFL